MKNTRDDIELFRHNLPEDELRTAIANREDPDQARQALKALSQRRSDLAPAAARSIVIDQSANEELRSTSAIELGRYLDGAAEESLLRAMSDASSALLKHIAKSLGQIGGKESLERLNKVAVPGDTPAGTALKFARSLISYRLGLDSYLIEPGGNAAALTNEATE